MSAIAADPSEPDAAQDLIRRLFAAALEAVEPARAVCAAMSIQGDTLIVGGEKVRASQGVHVVAVGKAAVAMTRGALQAIGEAIVSGDVITKEGHVDASLPGRLRIHEAGHPIPDRRGVAATEQALAALAALDTGDVVLALISGGGSALLEAPQAGITLQELALTTDALLRAGAPIDALNTVRAPLSRVKAGGLRAAAPAARWVTLILSDVLGNDPRVIASGPTVSADVDAARATEILARYHVRDLLPVAVLRRLDSGMSEPREEPAQDDVMLVIGDNAMAVDAAARQARARELRASVIWEAAQGEAAILGRNFVIAAMDAAATTDVVLGGGEATVTVRGDGVGGRNTEFALASALELERRSIDNWIVASLATDGQDALTGMAGAIADSRTCQRARAQGVDPEAALAQNDSLAVFRAAGGLVETGPTGTNVNDLYIAVRGQSGDRLSSEEGG